jgi:hypothetical protein
MDIKTAKCTVCGANLKLKHDENITTCSYCKSQVIVSNALAFAKVEVDRSKDLVKYRTNLKKYANNNSIEEILRVSNQILDILPKDFIANYYSGYALQVKGEPKFIQQFYNNILEHTEEEIAEISDHIFKRSDLRDNDKIKKFFSQISKKLENDFTKINLERLKLEDNYSEIPRDIFVCYKSKDNNDLIEKIVQKLEKDGNTCWVAYRNLRPDDSENYWYNIETAISNSKIFIVISDSNAMISKDVQKELSIAVKNKKRLIEFKIDKIPHTNLFNHVFDGIKWVDGYTSLKTGLDKLTRRVFEEKEIVKDLNGKLQWKAYIKPIAQVLTQKDKKKTLLISGAVFAATLIGVLAFNLFG